MISGLLSLHTVKGSYRRHCCQGKKQGWDE